MVAVRCAEVSALILAGFGLPHVDQSL